MSLQVFFDEDKVLKAALSEAILKSWSFVNQLVTIHLESDEGEDVFLYASTDAFFAKKVRGVRALDACRLEIVDLSAIFPIENDCYIPSANLKDVMKYKDFSFAYGRRAEFVYCISFVGSERLLVFPVRSLSDITYEIYG